MQEKKPECLNKLNSLLEIVSSSTRITSSKSPFSKYKKSYSATQPKHLVGGALKQYQIEALNWMIELATQGLNGILADEMGLGKTIQAISYLAYLKDEHHISGKHLIVAPKTVTPNWMNELQKWFPTATTVFLPATEDERNEVNAKVLRPRKFDILVTSYQGIISSYNSLQKVSWETIIVDQAHKLKNDESIISEYSRSYKCNFKLLLTGTPLSNCLRELWSLLNHILPQMFKDKNLFNQIEDFVNQCSQNAQQKFKKQCDIAKKFHKIILPFIKRRTKKDINLGLPPKTEKTLFVPLSSMQLKMYRNLLKYRHVLGPNHGMLNSRMMQMRKICNHPYLFNEIDIPDSEQGEHIINNSGKMVLMDRLLHKLISEQHKVLIFSQFTSQLDILEDYCHLRGYQFRRIDGKINLEDRQSAIEEFINDQHCNIPIFLLSTRSGGLGVNLVAADVVIIYDIDWNPQNDNQAMDRAHRIGQTKPVHVFKLITENTIQERMLQVQKYKLIWDQLVIQKGAMFKTKSEDVLSGLNFEKIALLGKGQIFRLNPSIKNNTIEEIIQMGVQKDRKKYEQIKAKVEIQLKEGENASKIMNPFDCQEDACQEQKLYCDQKFKKVELERRQKRQEMMQEEIKRKRIKAIRFPFYHLHPDEANLKELIYNCEVEQEKQHQRSEEQKSCSKSKVEELEAQIYKMKRFAFQDWKEEEFQAFVNAHGKFLKEEYELIAEEIKTKSASQVKQYSKSFFENKGESAQIAKHQKKVLIWQDTVQKNYERGAILQRIQKQNMLFYLKKKNIKDKFKKMTLTAIDCFKFKFQLQNYITNVQDSKRALANNPVAQLLRAIKGQEFYQQMVSLVKFDSIISANTSNTALSNKNSKIAALRKQYHIDNLSPTGQLVVPQSDCLIEPSKKRKNRKESKKPQQLTVAHSDTSSHTQKNKPQAIDKEKATNRKKRSKSKPKKKNDQLSEANSQVTVPQ